LDPTVLAPPAPPFEPELELPPEPPFEPELELPPEPPFEPLEPPFAELDGPCWLHPAAANAPTNTAHIALLRIIAVLPGTSIEPATACACRHMRIRA
jgi:hypothetical protein